MQISMFDGRSKIKAIINDLVEQRDELHNAMINCDEDRAFFEAKIHLAEDRFVQDVEQAAKRRDMEVLTAQAEIEDLDHTIRRGEALARHIDRLINPAPGLLQRIRNFLSL